MLSERTEAFGASRTLAARARRADRGPRQARVAPIAVGRACGRGRQSVRALRLAPPLVASRSPVGRTAPSRCVPSTETSSPESPLLRGTRAGEVGDVPPARRGHVDRRRAGRPARPRARVRRVVLGSARPGDPFSPAPAARGSRPGFLLAGTASGDLAGTAPLACAGHCARPLRDDRGPHVRGMARPPQSKVPAHAPARRAATRGDRCGGAARGARRGRVGGAGLRGAPPRPLARTRRLGRRRRGRGTDARRAPAASSRPPQLQVWVLEADGRVVSAVLFLSAGGVTTSWLGGFDDSYSVAPPLLLTIDGAVRHAFERGGGARRSRPRPSAAEGAVRRRRARARLGRPRPGRTSFRICPRGPRRRARRALASARREIEAEAAPARGGGS